jgi:hypothetical protein
MPGSASGGRGNDDETGCCDMSLGEWVLTWLSRWVPDSSIAIQRVDDVRPGLAITGGGRSRMGGRRRFDEEGLIESRASDIDIPGLQPEVPHGGRLRRRSGADTADVAVGGPKAVRWGA